MRLHDSNDALYPAYGEEKSFMGFDNLVTERTILKPAPQAAPLRSAVRDLFPFPGRVVRENRL